MKQKLTSYNFWIRMISVLLLFLRIIGNEFGFEIDSVLLMDIATALAGVLVVLGVISAPVTSSPKVGTEASGLVKNQGETIMQENNENNIGESLGVVNITTAQQIIQEVTEEVNAGFDELTDGVNNAKPEADNNSVFGGKVTIAPEVRKIVEEFNDADGYQKTMEELAVCSGEAKSIGVDAEPVCGGETEPVCEETQNVCEETQNASEETQTTSDEVQNVSEETQTTSDEIQNISQSFPESIQDNSKSCPELILENNTFCPENIEAYSTPSAVSVTPSGVAQSITDTAKTDATQIVTDTAKTDATQIVADSTEAVYLDKIKQKLKENILSSIDALIDEVVG